MQEQFKEVKFQLQQNWDSHHIRLKLDQAQTALQILRLDKLEKFQHKMASQWVRTGDRCSKEFFEFHKGFKSNTFITELVDGQKEYNTQEAIQGYITEHYRALYLADPETELQKS